KTTDIITNKNTGETFTMIAFKKGVNDPDMVTLKNIETEEVIELTSNDYKATYKVTEFGPNTDKFFML
ncbi:MAG: hypothetical protein ACRC2K_01605, partial [Clostridium sp.]